MNCLVLRPLYQKHLNFITETFPVLVEKEHLKKMYIITKGIEFLSNILALKSFIIFMII